MQVTTYPVLLDNVEMIILPEILIGQMMVHILIHKQKEKKQVLIFLEVLVLKKICLLVELFTGVFQTPIQQQLRLSYQLILRIIINLITYYLHKKLLQMESYTKILVVLSKVLLVDNMIQEAED